MEGTKEYLENRLKVLNFELGYFEDDDDNNNLASAKSTKQEIDEVNNLLILFSVSHPLPSWYKKLDLIGMQLEALQEDIPKNLKLRSNARVDLEVIDMRLTAMRSKLKLALDELKNKL